MRTGLLITAIVGGAMALPNALSAEDDAFEERVRAFLLENPEVIIEALSILSERETRAATIERVAAFPELFDDAPLLSEGDTSGPVRVVEFFDYKCVPCKVVHPDLVRFLEDRTDVHVDMRHLPILTPGSERAARFALATEAVYGTDEHRLVHDKLWDIRGPLNDAGFRRVADDLGLDFDRIVQLMDSEDVDARIAYNRNVAISLEILGTPAFVTRDSVTFGSTDVDALAKVWLSQ